MNATPPHEAKNRYLKDKSTSATDSTLSNYQTTLNLFCDWLTDKTGVKTLNALASDEIQQFKEWRLETVKTITLETDMTCIKDFIRFCEHINAVPDGMHQLVRVPEPNREDEVSSSILTDDEASEILDYLEILNGRYFGSLLFILTSEISNRAPPLRLSVTVNVQP